MEENTPILTAKTPLQLFPDRKAAAAFEGENYECELVSGLSSKNDNDALDGTLSRKKYLLAEFGNLTNLPFETIEHYLSIITTVLEYDLIRDLNNNSLLSGSALKEMIQIKLRAKFKENDFMNYNINLILDNISEKIDDLGSLELKEFQFFKANLEKEGEKVFKLQKPFKLKDLEQPLGDLIIFFEKSNPDSSIQVNTSFDKISEFLRNDPPSNRAVDSIIVSLKDICKRWKKYMKTRDGVLTDAQMECQNLIKEVRTVDFRALIPLLRQNRDHSDCLRGSDAIFLIGCTGVGKSTLIQFLGGSQFNCVHVEGAVRAHYEPIPASHELSKFVTSPYGQSETTCVQCFRLTGNNKSVWVVDTPGLGDTEGVVIQIANVVSIVRALKLCGRVKVVFCVSDYDMGNRIKEESFVHLCSSVVSLFSNTKDIKELSYVVTKLQRPEAGLHQIAAAFQREAQKLQQQELCKSLWFDFADKIDEESGAHAVRLNNPACRQEMLSDLMDFSTRTIISPETAFEEAMPLECREALTKQFNFHNKYITVGLRANDAPLVHHKIREIFELAELLKSNDSVDAFGRAVFEIFQVLSKSVVEVSNIVNDLLVSGAVWTADIKQDLLLNIQRICLFSDLYEEQFKRLKVEFTKSVSHFDVEHRSFLLETGEKWVLDMENAFKMALPKAEYFLDLICVRNFLQNIMHLDSMLEDIDDESRLDQLRSVTMELKDCRRRSVEVLQNIFTYYTSQCVEFSNLLQIRECLPFLAHMSEFVKNLKDLIPTVPFVAPRVLRGKVPGDVDRGASEGSPDSKSLVEVVTIVQDHFYHVIKKFIVERLNGNDVYESRENSHALLTSLQGITEQQELEVMTGLSMNTLNDLKQKLLNALISEMKDVMAVTLSIDDEKDSNAFSNFMDCLQKVDGIGNHSLLRDESSALRDNIYRHIDLFTKSVKGKCTTQFDLFWDETVDITTACDYELMKGTLSQLLESRVVFRTNHFDEIIGRSESFLTRFLEKREMTLVSFNTTSPEMIETQLRWKYRCQRLLILFDTGVDSGADSNLNDGLILRRHCEELVLTIEKNLFESLNIISLFYKNLIVLLSTCDRLVLFKQQLWDPFDFGKGVTTLLASLIRTTPYLSQSEVESVAQLGDSVSVHLSQHYEAINSILHQSYSWLMAFDHTEIISMQLNDGMFDDLSCGINYLQSMRQHHPTISSPVEYWTLLLQNFYKSSAKFAEQANIAQLTNLSTLCQRLGDAVDNCLPVEIHFTELSRTLQKSMKGSVKTTRLAIMNRDYEVVAQGLKNLDRDDFDTDPGQEDIGCSKVELSLQSSLKAALTSHVLSLMSKLQNLELNHSASSMPSLWKDLVQLNKAELFMRHAFGALEIQSNYVRLLESIDELSTKIDKKARDLRFLLNKGQVADALSIRSNLEEMLKGHRCKDLKRDSTCDYVSDCCQRCEQLNNPGSTNSDSTRNGDSDLAIRTELGVKVVTVMNCLYSAVTTVGSSINKMISSYKEKALTLSISTCPEDFTDRLPPRSILQDFQEHYDDYCDNDGICNKLVELREIISKEIEVLLNIAEKISDFFDDRGSQKENTNISSQTLHEINKATSILHEHRKSLPHLFDIDLNVVFKRRIEKCFDMYLQASSELEFRRKIQLTHSHNLEDLVEQYILSRDKRLLDEPISDAIRRFKVELNADLSIALESLCKQLPLWSKIGFTKNFTEDVKKIMTKLKKWLERFQSSSSVMEERLRCFSDNFNVIASSVIVIDGGIFELALGPMTDGKYNQAVLAKLLQNIIVTVHEHLKEMYDNSESFLNFSQRCGQTDCDLKRLPMLLKSMKLMYEYKNLYQNIAIFANSPILTALTVSLGDVTGMIANFDDLLNKAIAFMDDLHFINPSTQNVNTTDRETYYNRVAFFCFILEYVTWIPNISIPNVRDKITTNIQEWVDIGIASFEVNIFHLDVEKIESFSVSHSNLKLISKILPNFDKIANDGTNKMDRLFFVFVENFTRTILSCKEEGPDLIAEIAKVIINLQQIGNIVTVHSRHVSSAISLIVNHFQTKANAQGEEIISRLGITLNDCNHGLGQQIIAELPIFKGYEMYLRNTRFKQLSLDKMLENLEGSDVDKAALKGYVEAVTSSYWKIVEDNLRSKNRKKFSKITALTRNLARSDQNHTWQTVLDIVAHVFAYWTLTDIQHFENSGSKDYKYLLQPHLGQVIAILRLLSFDTEQSRMAANQSKGIFSLMWANNSFQLKNHLVQVRTGEGKSVILGVMSVVLALMNFEVDCVCYSKHLSTRDYQDFRGLFEAFGVDELICYGTFNEHFERALNRDGELRNSVEQLIINNGSVRSAVSKTAKTKEFVTPRILLIDEVDVFFQPGFYGSVYNVFATLKAHQFPQIYDLILSIWKCHNPKISEDCILHQVKNSVEFQSCCYLFAAEWHVLIEEAIKEMLSTLSTFKNHQYEFDSKTQRIGYLDNDNTISYNKVKGYNTMFAYCKEFHKGTITAEMLRRNLNILILSASFSYAEFPKAYTGILGVSGTLKTLSNQEKNILDKEYSLETFTYLSSAYGLERRLWDPNASSSILIPKESEFHVTLLAEIRRRQGEGSVLRPVLVFFQNKAEIEMFRENEIFAHYKGQALVFFAGMKEENQLEYIRRSMEKGRVSLLTREFGRGVNFYCQSKDIEAVGGVHVITTFVSVDFSEEVQIMGRAGRQGCSGSFSMVLPLSQMDLIGVDEKTRQVMEQRGNRYEVIHRHRLRTFESVFPERLKFIEQIKKEHDRSQIFVKAVREGDVHAVRNFLLIKNESQFGSINSRTVILLDATGSMRNLLSQAKLTVTTMIQRVVEVLREHSISSGFQIQFVAYRNYNSPPTRLLECSSWESSPTNLVQFINKIEPQGGWGNEAIEMALWHVNEEAKQMTITQVIIIGDAPPNTNDEVDTKRAQSSLLSGHARYNVPVYFDQELQSIRRKKIPIHAFYIKGTNAKDEFRRMAQETGGECEALDVHRSTAADILTGIVSTKILSDIGRILGGSASQALVNSYRAKYPFQTEGFI